MGSWKQELVGITLLGAALSAPGLARAQAVVNINSAVASANGIDATQAKSQMTSAIDSQLKLDNQQDYLESVAQAAVFSSKGIGADYASNASIFVGGFTVGYARNTSNEGETSEAEDVVISDTGRGVQVAAMGGVNLGFGDEETLRHRFRIFFNGGAYSYENSSGSLAFDLYNFGTHGQLQVVEPVTDATGSVGWGGLALTTGYELASFRYGLLQDLPVDATLSGKKVTWDATGQYDVTTTSHAIPLELSTNVRLMALTFFGGGALDFNFASAESFINMSGPLEVKSSKDVLGDSTVDANSEARPDVVAPRAFAGAQINIFAFKLYAHANFGTNQNFGGHAGFRIAL